MHFCVLKFFIQRKLEQLNIPKNFELVLLSTFRVKKIIFIS